MNMDKIISFLPLFIALAIAVILHEVAHGVVAYWRGDDTAKLMGRLTLNPIKHIDPFGTVILPIALKLLGSPFLFGYAKPVPVQFHRLNNPRFDGILVAVAGPLTNIILSVLSIIALYKAPGELLNNILIKETLIFSFQINIVLACFNMIPILPLDGGRVFEGLLPRPLAREFAKTEQYGMFVILISLAFMPQITQLLIGKSLSFFELVLEPMVNFTREKVIFIANLIV